MRPLRRSTALNTRAAGSRSTRPNRVKSARVAAAATRAVAEAAAAATVVAAAVVAGMAVEGVAAVAATATDTKSAPRFCDERTNTRGRFQITGTGRFRLLERGRDACAPEEG